MNGSFVRQAIFGAPMPRQTRRPPIERRELARLLGQIGHIGSNINQLAHMANIGEPVSSGEVIKALAELRVVRDAILIALGREP